MADTTTSTNGNGSTSLAGKLADITLKYGVGPAIAFYTVYLLGTITLGNVASIATDLREHVKASQTIEKAMPAIVALLQEQCYARADAVTDGNVKASLQANCRAASLGFAARDR